MKTISAALCALVLVPALASAQPRTPDDFYKEGETQYNLGEFQKAIEAFKKGFELETSESKKSAYLYNIAQSYRQAKDCSNAQFFYKRYLALKENDTAKPLRPEKRAEIQERIKELEECARQQEAIRQKPPDQNPEDDPSKKPLPPPKVVAEVPPEEDPETDITKSADPSPRVISIRGLGGGAKISTGDLDVPIQATAALFAGYPIALQPKLTLEIGAGFTFTPVPYERTDTMESKSATLLAVFANIGATYHVTQKIGLRGDLGLGALFFTGVSESPFTDNAPTDGALGMLHVRAGISGDYAITRNVIATITPIAFSYSPPKEGLDESIKSITALDFMVGLGYRM
ncbi:MAG: tetratricopeptide repeat protein [Kofleriaceae bacterium]